MLHIYKDIKDIVRFDKILLVFFEEGFSHFIHKIGFVHRIPLHKRIHYSIKQKGSQESEVVRLRKTFQRLGPTFIKLGQVLSTRPDLLSKEYLEEFTKLQEHNDPVPVDKIKKLIEQELGKNFSEVFKTFEEKPLAVASISQVHRATLLDGSLVVIKVQKPGAKETVLKDIDIMLFLAHFLEKHVSLFKNYAPVKVVEQFAEWTIRELNFKNELYNLVTIKKNFPNEEILIPKAYDQYCSEHVIIMEYLEGSNVNTHKFHSQKEKNELTQTIAQSVAKMIFVDGIFHADPHLGNIYVAKNNKPIFYDFGMVGFLDERLRIKLATFFNAVHNNNTEVAFEALISLTYQTSNANTKLFYIAVEQSIARWHGKSLRESSLALTVKEVLSAGASQGFVFDKNLILLAKTITSLEGLALALNPNLRIDLTIKKHVEFMVKKENDPRTVAKRVWTEWQKHGDLYTHFPEHITKLLERIESGKVEIHIDSQEVGQLEQYFARLSFNKSLAIIFAAFLISAGLFLTIDKELLFFTIHISYILLICAFITLILFFKNISQTKE